MGETSVSMIGVFLCSCKKDLSKVIDFKGVSDFIRKTEGVTVVEIHDALCERAGQLAVQDAIKSLKLDCVVIGGCSPKLYESMFRETIEGAGLNPFLVEMVNLREQGAWVHSGSPKLATEKAKLLVRGAIRRAKHLGNLKYVKAKSIGLKEPVDRRKLFRGILTGLRGYEVTPTVDGGLCNGFRGACKYCRESCPFQAVVYKGGRITIEEDPCQACGICCTVCPLGAIQLPNYTDIQLGAQIEGFLMDEEVKLRPRILAFSCYAHGYLSADMAGAKRLSYPPNILILRVPCVGLVSEVAILKAFDLGADGILLLGCQAGSCQFRKGDLMAREKVSFIKKVLSAFKLQSERIDIIESSEEKPEDFVKGVEDFVAKINSIGQNPLSTKTMDPSRTRRETLLNLLRSFSEKSKVTPKLVEKGAPYAFADLILATEKCTVCGACISFCPTKTLKRIETKDSVKIDFNYALCIGCGLCEVICPEKAIKIDHVLDLQRLVEISERPLIEQTFILCKRCGKPFIPAAAFQKVLKTLQKGSPLEEKQLKLMKLCPECRGKAVAESLL